MNISGYVKIITINLSSTKSTTIPAAYKLHASIPTCNKKLQDHLCDNVISEMCAHSLCGDLNLNLLRSNSRRKIIQLLLCSFNPHFFQSFAASRKQNTPKLLIDVSYSKNTKN